MYSAGMGEGRAPWPRFAADCTRVLAPVLAELGYTAQLSGGSSARFEHPAHRVELSWDAYEVLLEVCIDGIAIERLLATAGHRERINSEPTTTALREVGEALVLLLAMPQLPSLVVEAGQRLSMLKRGDEGALIRLLQSAEASDLRVRAAAFLGELCPASGEAVAALAGAVADPDASLRAAAASALYHVGAVSPAVATRALARGVQDAELTVRRESLLALRQLGKRARAAVAAVVEVLHQGSAAEAVLAGEALGAISPARMSAETRALESSPRRGDRDRAARLQRMLDSRPRRPR